MRRLYFTAILVTVAVCSLTLKLPAQEGLGERLGEPLDSGVEQVTDELKRSWDEIKESVDKLEVEGRVYSRLHWDRRLAKANLEVEAGDAGAVVVTGTISNQKLKKLALQLAQETVGVKKVVDQLAIHDASR